MLAIVCTKTFINRFNMVKTVETVFVVMTLAKLKGQMNQDLVIYMLKVSSFVVIPKDKSVSRYELDVRDCILSGLRSIQMESCILCILSDLQEVHCIVLHT